jgi:hypothetical protein
MPGPWPQPGPGDHCRWSVPGGCHSRCAGYRSPRGHDHARQAIDGITVGDLKLPPKLVQIDLNSEMVLVRGEAAEAQLAKVTGRRTETPEQIGEEGDSRS